MKKKGPKHVLLLSVDDLRFDALSCESQRAYLSRYGAAHLTRTPKLDAFAAGGVRFSGCRVAATITPPSHATMLTGHYPFRHGVRLYLLNRLRETSRTLFERMSAAGFTSLAAVDFPELFELNGLLRGARALTPRHDRFMLDAFQASAKRGQRVFLFHHVGDVHAAYGMTKERTRAKDNREMINRYDALAKKLGVRYRRGLVEKVRTGQLDSIEMWNPILAKAESLGQAAELALPLYLEGVSRYDGNRFKRLLDELENRDLLDDTVIVLTADHGEGAIESGSSVTFGHGDSVAEDMLRVPLIFWCSDPKRLAGFKPGKTIDLPVSTADIAPTILGLLGIKTRASEFDGMDRSALVLGGRGGKPSPCYAEAWNYGVELGPFLTLCVEFLMNSELEGNPSALMRNVKLAWQTVRERDKKFVKARSGKGALYDLESDPYETRNLAGTERAVMGRLESWLKKHHDAAIASAGKRMGSVDGLEQSLRTLGYLK